MTLTKDQLDSLYPAEIHFDRALNQGTIVSPPRWLSERVCDILDLVTGKKHSRQLSCATCLFQIYKEAGKMYFDSLNTLKTKNKTDLKTNLFVKNIEQKEDASTPKIRSKRSKNKDNKG